MITSTNMSHLAMKTTRLTNNLHQNTAREYSMARMQELHQKMGIQNYLCSVQNITLATNESLKTIMDIFLLIYSLISNMVQ